MLSEIGINSGSLWVILNEKGAQTVAQIKAASKLSEFDLAIALGWLAREDKITIEKKGRSINISLK